MPGAPFNCFVPISSAFSKAFGAFLLLSLVASRPAHADFVPIPLTPGSFNHDLVVERGAPPPLVPVTTASMDTGTNNTGFSFYEAGYNLAAGSTGLPAAGSTFTSQIGDHDYQLAPTYRSNNAVLIDS